MFVGNFCPPGPVALISGEGIPILLFLAGLRIRISMNPHYFWKAALEWKAESGLALKPKFRAVDAHSRGSEAQNVAWRIYWPVVADSYHFVMRSRVRIRISDSDPQPCFLVKKKWGSEFIRFISGQGPGSETGRKHFEIWVYGFKKCGTELHNCDSFQSVTVLVNGKTDFSLC